MPILRALIVLLVVPLAYANETEDCGDALAGKLSVPLSVLTRDNAFEPFDGFVVDFVPWRPRGREVVGGRPDGRSTWRLNFLAKRMVYEQPNLRGGAGFVNLARHASRAALAAHASGMDLRSVKLSFSPEGALVADLPMTKQGTEFVIALENRMNHVRDFQPIDLMRWPSYIDRLPRTKAEYDAFVNREVKTPARETADSSAPEPRRSLVSRLAFWRKAPAEAPIETPAPASVPPEAHDPAHSRDLLILTDGEAFAKIPPDERYLLPNPEKIRAFTDEQVAHVSEWLETQFPGLHIHTFNRTIDYDVPTANGMRDVVAHARRVSELAIDFARPGLDLSSLKIAVTPDAKTFRISGIPFNETGALFLEQFEARRADGAYQSAAVVVPGLSLAEIERVRDLLTGLEPTILYAKGETSYFVRPPDVVPPSLEELEAIHQAKGGALPFDLRKSYQALTRNEAAFSSLAPWTHQSRRTESEPDLWTARGFDCDVTINITTGRISFAFLGQPGEARARVERALTSLFSTKDHFDFSSLKLELGHGLFSGKLILSSSIDRLATRVLSEIRIPAEIDDRDFATEHRRRATVWFQEQYDDARAARGGATPVRTAAE